jgi:hypothetical protein
LAKNEYLMRHEKVGAHLRYWICKALGIEMTDTWHARMHAHPYVNMKMWQCCGIKEYTQTEMLQQISEI